MGKGVLGRTAVSDLNDIATDGGIGKSGDELR